MQVVVYCRVSTDAQAEEGYSLAAQERLCREAAARRGDTVLAVVRDAGEHGDDPNRPGLREVMSYLQDGADGVYVTDLDRFHRSYRHYLTLAHEIIEAGCHLYTVNNAADYADEDQRTLLDMLAAFGAGEVRKIRRRVRQALSQRAQEGLTLGPPPFGYQKAIDERGNAIADEPIEPAIDEAVIVRELFNRYRAGESLQGLAEDMVSRGVRTHRGTVRWTASRIGDILRNPVYRGRVVHGDEDYPGEHFALIDAELWRAVQKRLNERAAEPKRRRYHLSGLMRCGACGGTVRISTSADSKRNYFHCAERLHRPPADRHEPFSARAEAVEALCWAFLRRAIAEDMLAEAVLRHQQEASRRGRADKRAEVAQRLAEVEEEISLSLRAVGRGLLPEDMLEDQNRPLVTERETLRRELARIDAANDIPTADLEWARNVGHETLERAEQSKNAGVRRETLQRVIERVDLWGDCIVIHPRFADVGGLRVQLPKYWRTEWGSDEAVDLL